MAAISIDGDRLQKRLMELAAIGRTPEGGVTRLSFQDEHAKAVQLVALWMQAAGAEIGLDEWGNLFGIIPGTMNSLPPIAVGSHLDTVPNGGIFDGALGVVAGVEVATALRDVRVTLRRPLLLIAFAEEEGTSFGVGCLGSLGVVGRAPAPGRLRDLHGVSLADRLRAFDPAVPRHQIPVSMAAYLELHIEQGPTLAAEGIPLAAVKTIVGIAHSVFVFLGEPNHAGTTPMAARRDALWGAADFVAAMRAMARDAGGRAVGTVGRCKVLPGATNVIPGRVEVTAELRSPENDLLRTLCQRAEEAGRLCANSFGLELEIRPWNVEPAIRLSHGVHNEVCAAAADLEWPIVTMPSWAGHDAKVLAGMVPTGMIFVPSVEGISHSPSEYTTWEDVARGTQVLCRTVERLDVASGL